MLREPLTWALSLVMAMSLAGKAVWEQGLRSWECPGVQVLLFQPSPESSQQCPEVGVGLLALGSDWLRAEPRL